MPLASGGRYRMKRLKGGGFERLHFAKGGDVDEVKNMKTGATHTMKITSKLPAGVSLSPKGDLCAARMKEIEAVFPRGMKGTHAPKMPGECFPTKGMQLPK